METHYLFHAHDGGVENSIGFEISAKYQKMSVARFYRETGGLFWQPKVKEVDEL
jgi:hypothetical protein